MDEHEAPHVREMKCKQGIDTEAVPASDFNQARVNAGGLGFKGSGSGTPRNHMKAPWSSLVLRRRGVACGFRV